MQSVTVKDKEFVPMIPAADIGSRVAAIAQQINTDYMGKTPLFLGVLNGAFLFMADIFRNITLPCELSFIKVSSYSGISSSGNMKSLIGLTESVKNRHVIIVEDIVDTGDTMKFLLDELHRQQPASVKLATFLFKPAALKHNLQPDYIGFEINPAFVVGYGLDYDGFGRNLNDIYVLKES